MDPQEEFTLAEMVELEAIYKEIGQEALNPDFCQRLATSFSLTPNRAGKPAITSNQVQSWFQEKRKKLQPKTTPSLDLNLFVDLSNANISSNALATSQKPKVERATDISELIFEARSAKDNAWYDVAAFLNYRILSCGELEARVRFAGFHNTHDEWVNVQWAVRERSIPLEPSECHKVKVGDLVLCFRERAEAAVYYDAHILEIRRQLHDITGCRCTFLVRYDHDSMEENVHLERICCRPKQ